MLSRGRNKTRCLELACQWNFQSSDNLRISILPLDWRMSCKSPNCCAKRRMSDGPIAPDALVVAGEFQLSDGTNLLKASQDKPIALVFLRHFGCTFTRQILRGLQELENDAQARDARLVLVHMLQKGEEKRYLGDDSTVSSIADPKCRLYRAFGLGKGGLLELFGPKVWWLGMKAIFKGCGVGRLAGNGLQMPGAFLFHRGEIIAAQRAETAADLPDLPRLFGDSNPSRP